MPVGKVHHLTLMMPKSTKIYRLNHYGAPFRFSPELLGVQASSALVWLVMEVLAVLLSLYLVTVNTDLTTIDLLAFSGYKYVGCVL